MAMVGNVPEMAYLEAICGDVLILFQPTMQRHPHAHITDLVVEAQTLQQIAAAFTLLEANIIERASGKGPTWFRLTPIAPIAQLALPAPQEVAA